MWKCTRQQARLASQWHVPSNFHTMRKQNAQSGDTKKIKKFLRLSDLPKLALSTIDILITSQTVKLTVSTVLQWRVQLCRSCALGTFMTALIFHQPKDLGSWFQTHVSD